MPGLMTRPANPEEVFIDARLRGESQEAARRHVEHTYSIRDERQLDEELAGAEPAFQAELARRPSAEAPPAVEQEDEPLSLDALEADARQRIAKLNEQRGRLSLDALTDEDVCLELSNLEGELEAAESELQRIALARGEAARRAPIEAAEEEKKKKALAAAEKLAAKEATRGGPLAKAVDQAAEAFATAVKEHRTHIRRHRELLEEAGILKPVPFGFQPADLSYELALRFVLSSHGLGEVLERPQSSWGRPPNSPLAEPAEK